ncbi:DUF300-domain-containing protein [Sistotremastrum niveocremeum HHB9708]|uniref:DUF300-domain-containing protein n=1 Tax=Sistotremastrum niveocremeum HHB9708 TaxID=1314777 RepID=A0A164WIS6_9AGAM|nr:DUF300-domain-containing protein [Sistotremastrum niveocremeum HHB9708]
MPAICAGDNTLAVEQDNFWKTLLDGGKLQPHQIGWLVSGICATLSVIITTVNAVRHARNYHVPLEQRQILRILQMPPIYATISFFSYRYFRSYTYFDIVQVIYESFTVCAFFLLILQYVARTAGDNHAENALRRKDKRRLPFPFMCFLYRPTKVYFMYTLKWSILQYAIIGPLVAIVGVITNVFGLYCESGPFNPHFAHVYLEVVNFVSNSITFYALSVFQGLTSRELSGLRPKVKFFAIQFITSYTFYQSLLFSILEKTGTIKSTTFWTQANVANGLNSLCICVEMVFMSLFMFYAYPAGDYVDNRKGKTAIWRPLVDSFNISDFVIEIWRCIRFFIHFLLGHYTPAYKRPPPSHKKLGSDNDGFIGGFRPFYDFDTVFGLRAVSDMHTIPDILRRASDAVGESVRQSYAFPVPNPQIQQHVPALPLPRISETVTERTESRETDKEEDPIILNPLYN